MLDLPQLRDHSPPASANRRADVLTVLRRSEQPLSAAEVADKAGLHLNTARAHLDALSKEGLADRLSERRSRPGRPRLLYSAQGPMPGERSYPLLAEMLTGLVSSLEQGASLAQEAGREWGRHLLEGPPPSRRIAAPEASELLHELMDRLGFEPERAPADQSTGIGGQMRLHNCPFREIAQEHPDVVCGLHLGIMQGAIERLRAPLEVTSLDPFVTPHTCAAQLRSVRPPDPGTRAPRST